MSKKSGISPSILKYEDAFEDTQMLLYCIIRNIEAAPVLEDLYLLRDRLDDMLEIVYEIGGIKL